MTMSTREKELLITELLYELQGLLPGDYSAETVRYFLTVEKYSVERLLTEVFRVNPPCACRSIAWPRGES